SRDITLEPMAAAPAPGASIGTRLAVIRTGEASAGAGEARSAPGHDSTPCPEGVLRYRVTTGTPSGGGPGEVLDTHPRTDACWDRSVYAPLADAPLRVGET
ncbi:peptidase M6, partial [Streptomyces sp. JV190]|nr:peptidase M6 [Streptomyces sp. JV190]